MHASRDQKNPPHVDHTALRRLQLSAALGAGCMAACMAVLMAGLYYSLWHYKLHILVMLEVPFAAVWLWKYHRFNQQPLPHAPPATYNARDVFDRFTKDQEQLSKYICIKDMLSRWFWDIPADKIHRGNVADLLTYGFWYKSREQLAAEGQADLGEQLVREIEQAWGVTFPEGHNPQLPFMAHLWQNIWCHYRPFMFYLAIEALFLLKHAIMLAMGFRPHSHAGFTYYTLRINSAATSHQRPDPQPQPQPQQHSQQGPGSHDTTPLLFMHGVGLGLLPYITFIMRLAATGHPVIALECNHLGMRLCSSIPDTDTVVGALVGVLDRHGLGSVAVVAHSYGTFMASRFLQLHKTRVHSVCLVDPVCFCMFSGKLIYNFVYNYPLKGSSLITWFIARDIHHATSVCRTFFWSLLNLWPDQLPANAMVVLAGKDELVPIKESLVMLEPMRHVQLMYHPDHKHADFIFDLGWQAKIVQQVAIMAKQPPSSIGHARSDSASSYEMLQAQYKLPSLRKKAA